MKEPHLYHSFPRVRDNETPDDKVGMAILTSILKHGFLLTPEVIEYPGKINDKGEEENRIKLLQCKFSLTAIDDTENLKEHAITYGGFHLEFTCESGYLIGAMPVMHIPKSRDSVKESLWHLGSSFVRLISDFKTMASMLEYLDKAAADFAAEKKITVSTETGIEKEIYVAQLRNILDLILDGIADKDEKEGAREKEFNRIQGAIQGLCSLIYFTDHIDKIGRWKYLHHFWVREWRIVQGMSVNGKEQDRDLTEEEKEAVKAVNESFFGGRLDVEIDGKRPRVIDMCRLLPSVDGVAVTELINRIIVPAHLYKQALAAAVDNGFPKGKIVSSAKQRNVK
jgi:hypothetical protein